MNQPPRLPDDQSFTAEDINSALSDLPEEVAQSVVERISARTAEAKHIKAVQHLQMNTAMLAIIAHQNYQEDTPDDLDDISLDRATRDQSIRVLDEYGQLPEDDRVAIPASAIDFAACFYTQREIVFGASKDELEELLVPAGYTLDKMRDRLTELLFESPLLRKYKTLEELRAAAPDLYSIAEVMYSGNIFAGLAESMRNDLIEKGYRLPELGPDHTYGYDDEEEEYIIPIVTPDNLPPAAGKS
jgi:hypothetical protein